jgi:hypothetical protein
VSWFSTKAFHFELPGESWEEMTTHVFQPQAQDRTTFAINRQKGSADLDLAATMRETPSPYLEREIVRSEHRHVGSLDAQDVSVIGRSRESADYHRVVLVSYYDVALSFQWAGPASARDAIDATVERSLETLRFRSR